METKLFFARNETNNKSNVKRLVAVVAAGSLFGLAGCGSEPAENSSVKSAKSNSSLSAESMPTTTVEMPEPSASTFEETPEVYESTDVPPVEETYTAEEPPVVEVPAAEGPLPEIAPAPPEVVVPTPPVTKPEHNTNSDVLYGETCEALPDDIRLTTTIIDGKNKALNSDGVQMSGLKQNTSDRVKLSLVEHDDTARMVLSDTQNNQVEESVSEMIDATFGGDIAPDNGASSYDITYVGYASDKKSHEFNAVPMEGSIDGLPTYQLTDISFCIAAINKVK